MRRNTLTLSLMAALLLGACAPSAQTNAPDAIAPTPVSSPAATETLRVESPETAVAAADNADLPPRFQGLDPIEISRAEIDELILLEKEQSKAFELSRAAFKAWREQDPTRRGQRPSLAPSTFPLKDKARLSALWGRLQNAEIRKKYETLDSNILTKAEVQEIITLEQKQAKLMATFQNLIEIWSVQDPATRGPEPKMDMNMMWGDDPRLIELQGKLESLEKIERMVSRVEDLSATYNISLSDSQMSELTEIETEQHLFEVEFEKAMMAAGKQNQLTGDEMSEEMAIKMIPKDMIKRMWDMEERKTAIMAPLETAKQADRVQTTLTKLSQESGVPILSGEISESVTLSAEKGQIKRRTEQEVVRRWMEEDGPLPIGEPWPNDEDYARLKEIDARLKAITAPMTDAKQAAAEADNPGLRESRLKQESREKWREDWRDKQQAGTIPPGTPMTSPSYAEVKDRVTDYGTKLKARADKVGYAVPETDVERLDALNEQMLAIRKSVYDMERNGSSHMKGRHGMMTSTSETTSHMFKIQLIEQKQQEILADLVDAEGLQRGTESSRAGETQFNENALSEPDAAIGVEAMIERYKSLGQEISDSDADDLRAFERELQER